MARLTRARWVEEGLTVLREEGPAGLAADRMARRLGVSRGSFYWHFASALDFEAALLGAWEEQWTARIIAAVEQESGGPRARLRSLIEKTGGEDASLYASAKRMAREHRDLEALLARVDGRRIDFVRALLAEAGLSGPAAELRARIIYAWAMGQMLVSGSGEPVPAGLADALIAFAFAPEG